MQDLSSHFETAAASRANWNQPLLVQCSGYGRSKRQIAAICRVSRNTVRSYLVRFERSGLKGPLPDDVTDAELERRLFRRSEPKQVTAHRAVPGWAYIHHELRRKGVTLQLLWDEYPKRYLHH